MSSRRKNRQAGWGLMAIGVLMIVGAAVAWLVRRAPDEIAVRQLEPPTLIPAAVAPAVVPTDPALPLVTAEAVATLPTPIPTAPLVELPSVARLDEAPNTIREVVPGQPERLVIPSIGVDAPVRDVGLSSVFNPAQGEDIFYQWQVPQQYAAGWHHNSAPLGTAGNTVLNGHQNIYGEVFRDLEDLEVGDGIILYDHDGQSYLYEITVKEILPEENQPAEVRAQNARWIQRTMDERLTLVTCWPYTNNSHRLVIVAQPMALP